jgi:uncharacterized protein YdeI (YjbR/CyaY-like superfamily)
MGKRDKRIDAYIAKSAEFAQPILKELREIIHEGCPDAEETLKWSMPFFLNNGNMLCHFASFKQHCAFGFWKGRNVVGEDANDEAMGHFGRITSVKDLPSRKTMVGYVKKAVAQAEERAQAPAKPKAKAKPVSKELVIPEYFAKAVAKNKKALKTFDGFSYSRKKEYVEWVTEAKTDETRDRRIATALEWLAEGKSRHWKYEKC